MSKIAYRPMGADEPGAVSTLVLAEFEQYIAPDYTPQGIEEFRNYADADAIRQRSAEGYFILVASTDDGLAGMIEIRQSNHFCSSPRHSIVKASRGPCWTTAWPPRAYGTPTSSA